MNFFKKKNNKENEKKSVFDNIDKIDVSNTNEHIETDNNSLVENNNELSLDNNKTFFEKFEKTKKSFKKESKFKEKETKKVLISNFRNLSLTNKLNNFLFLKISWIVILIVSILFLTYVSVVLSYLSTYFNGAPSSGQWSFVNLNLSLSQTAIVCSGIVLSLIVCPYIFLIATWFVGMGKIYKNNKFFIINFLCLLISLICILIVIGTTSQTFSFVSNFRPII